jgi:hypothetical protein
MANASRIEGRGPVGKTASSKDDAEGRSVRPRITYFARTDASAQCDLRSLAACYAFVIAAQKRKEAAATYDDAKGGELTGAPAGLRKVNANEGGKLG